MVKEFAIICPRCKELINAGSNTCINCGLVNPGGLGKIYKIINTNVTSLVKVLMIANIGMYVLSLIVSFLFQGGTSGGFLTFLGPSNAVLNLLGWSNPTETLRGEFWQLVSATFLHGGFLHILFNMMWINDLGKNGESFFNTKAFLSIYILAGMAGNIVAILLGTVVVGASGAVLGMMGAMFAIGRQSSNIYMKMFVFQYGKWAFILIALGFFIPGVSNSAHIGGFVAGYFLGKLLPINKQDGALCNLLSIGVIALLVYTLYNIIIRLLLLF